MWQTKYFVLVRTCSVLYSATIDLRVHLTIRSYWATNLLELLETLQLRHIMEALTGDEVMDKLSTLKKLELVSEMEDRW